MGTSPEGSRRGPGGIRLAAGLLAAVLLILCAFVVARQWRGVALLEQGRASSASGGGPAEVLLLKSLRRGNGEAAVELAKRAYAEGQWADVRRFADEALRINPYQGYAHTLKAYAMAAGNMPADAGEAEGILEECRRAVAVEPAGGSLWRSCAELSLRLYLHLFPEGGLSGPSSVYRAEALGFYHRALQLSPRMERPFVAAMAEQGPDALFMVQALRDASLPAVRETVGVLLDRNAWWAVRRTFWEAAAGAAVPRAYYRGAAEALRSRKRFREAFSSLEQYPFADRDDAPLAYLAALSAEALGESSDAWTEAEQFYQLAVRLDGDRSEYRRRLGMHLFRKGDPDAAESHLLQAASESPGDHQSRYYLGRIAEARGDADGALEYFRAALSLQPANGHYRKLVEEREGKGR